MINARLYGAGGSETHLLNLCRLLAQHGAEVTVVSRFARPETPLVELRSELPVRLVATPFAGELRLFRFSTAWALAMWPFQLRPGQFDVLYTLEVSRFTSFLARFVGAGGWVIGNRFGEPLGEKESLPAQALGVLRGFVVESELQAQALRRKHANSFPLAVIPHIGHVADLPRREPRKWDVFRVAFLGRYGRAKGIYRLLEIWPELPQSMHLEFFGHGPERAILEQEIEGRGLGQRVQVNGGWRDAQELRRIMASIDLVVLPSETEGVPMVLLEAMAHGVPFVATDVGAVRTLAEENPDVLVVPQSNRALKEALVTMENDIQSGKVVGERLQQYHRARFGYERLSRLWTQALLNPEEFWSPLGRALDSQPVMPPSLGALRSLPADEPAQ
ncbi:MAG TPA: glycosyltransferase family 4 protein [Terriglobales bacterium]|nr:glycosyltransferase family 4 protein [Terriglobales bacterium]